MNRRRMLAWLAGGVAAALPALAKEATATLEVSGMH
jgi:hypothetical protein